MVWVLVCLGETQHARQLEPDCQEQSEEDEVPDLETAQEQAALHPSMSLFCQEMHAFQG